MSTARTFNTPVDRYVRRSGVTRKALAQSAMVSTSSLYKARALNTKKGKLHWTTLVLIGARMGIFRYGESVDEHDPRLKKLARASMRSNRGKGAPNFDKFRHQHPSQSRLRQAA